VSRYQKGKTNLDFTEARDSEWQWHQLGHMQVCTSLQTNNHTSTPPLSFFTGRMPFLPPNQQRQSTEGKLTTTSNDTKSQEEQRARHTNKLIFDGFHDFSIFQFKTLRKTSQQLRTQLLTVTCRTLQ